MLTFVHCLSLINLHITSALEIPIFFRDEIQSHFFSVDIPSDMKAADLYQQIPEIGISDVLSVGGIEIRKTDTRHISELSICPETVINIIRRSPTDAECLYQFAKDLKNKELLTWWSFALKCHQFPELEECQQHNVCKWPRIGNEGNITTLVCVDTSIMPVLRCCLSGTMVLRKLPRTVTVLEATGAAFDEVDFRGLMQHELRSISVASNRIKYIDFSQLKGSSVERLDLASNAISAVNLSALEGTSITNLFLDGNDIEEITFRGLADTKLERLDLQGNKLRMIKFEGLEGSSLQQLHLNCNPIEMIDFKGISASSLRYIWLTKDQQITARNVGELQDCMLESYIIERILRLIREER